MSSTSPRVRRNDTVDLIRSIIPSGRKQPGRRFGPAPKHTPHERMQSPAPMSVERRLAVYGQRPGSSFTHRQEEQMYRMGQRVKGESR